MDSVAASSEADSNRREIPALGLSDSYGIPIPGNSYGPPADTYGLPVRSNSGLPIPVYGIPNGPGKNIIYPALPPDIPPRLPSIPSGAYGPPKPVYGPPLKLHPPTHHKSRFNKPNFLPFHHKNFKSPRPSYGIPPPNFVPKQQYGPPPPVYGPPLPIYSPPTPVYGPPGPSFGIPTPVYGPPKIPKPAYGPPLKPNYISPKPLFKIHKPNHDLIKINSQFGSPLATYGPPHTGPLFSLPSNTYGLPPVQYGPPVSQFGHSAIQYVAPEPVLHGHPHPGAPAPPTPPDIKYDGWQPIPGLVAHPHGGGHHQHQQQHQQQYVDNGDHGSGLTPPVNNDFSSQYASSFGYSTSGIHGNGFNAPSDSYGAPLNSVTGSGGVVGSSFGQGANAFTDDSSLSVIKSIGYEIFPTGSFGGGGSGKQILDTYSAPPVDSFAPDGPYPAALQQSFNGNLGSNGIGLIPPSGLYGVPPGGQYGTPILSLPQHTNGGALNALNINPPKSPVVFREPVPQGLIESIGESVVHKDAQGIEHSQSNFHGQAYIPPPVPDITKQTDFGGQGHFNGPNDLYSLPNARIPTSFQSVVQGPNHNGIDNNFGNSEFFNFGDQGSEGQLTSYSAPLGAIDSSYGIPLQAQALTANFDHLQSFDFGGALASSYQIPQISLQSTLPHDCSQHKSQPFGSFAVPAESASSYATSISSLNTNIGGQSSNQIPLFNFNTDLSSVQSFPNPIVAPVDLSSNSVDIQEKNIGQQYFEKDSDFQQSQKIHIPNGVQNIPVQGNLGSYTLQIQSADSATGEQVIPENIPHEQVLSEGLLQSILAAIEQPSAQQQLPFSQQNVGYNSQVNSAISYQQQNIGPIDGDAQHSVTRPVIITPPVQPSAENKPNIQQADESLQLIDNNEIALYFNNNENLEVSKQEPVQQDTENSNTEQDKANLEVRNGQQYGSFVSFKTPQSSYVYGELKNVNGTDAVMVKKETQ